MDPAFIIYINLIEFQMDYGLDKYFASTKALTDIKKTWVQAGSGRFFPKIAENIGLYRKHPCTIYKS